MMMQLIEQKEEVPRLPHLLSPRRLLRVCFFDDAITAARELELALTGT